MQGLLQREMSSDNLTRHMKQHSSVQQTTEEICKDILLDLSDKVIDMQSAHSTKRKFKDSDNDEEKFMSKKKFIMKNLLSKKKYS